MNQVQLNNQLELFRYYKRLYNSKQITDKELLELLSKLELRQEIKTLLKNHRTDPNKMKELNEYIELYNKLTIQGLI